MAAPTFFGKGVLSDENAGTDITAIAPPASTQADDIVVMFGGCNGSSTFVTPTDYTVLGTSLESDAGQSTEWYWRRLTAADGNTTIDASATFSNTVGGYGQKWVFRGCITTGNPFESVGNAGTVSETTPDSSAVTTTDVDRLVVCICLLDNDTDFASGFPPSGWTDMGGLSASTVGGDWATRAMQRTEATATTVASAVVGTLGASTRWRTISFALIPAPASFTGTVAETQDNQTSTATGWITVTGTVAETQDAQTSTASGVLGYTGTSARTQDNQTSTATGVLGYSGTSARTQDNQTSTASGTVGGASEITGSVAETQDNQTSTASGVLGYTGTSARTQADQTATASGWILIFGTVAETQDNQTSTASGTVTVPPVTGMVAETQDAQTATAAGWITVTGVVSGVQSNQVAVAAGFVGEIPFIPDVLPIMAIRDPHVLIATSAWYTLAATSAQTSLVALED